MPFTKGKSGNPSGRPPKNRALTDLLEAAGDTKLELDGKKIARKRVVASLAWELLTVGEATLPGGKVLRLDPQDWLGLYKWIYQHIDGPPKQEVDVTSGGEKVAAVIGVVPIDYRAGLADIAPRSISDSDASGEDKDPGDGSQVG